jgi:hypothetical protein
MESRSNRKYEVMKLDYCKQPNEVVEVKSICGATLGFIKEGKFSSISYHVWTFEEIEDLLYTMNNDI